MRWPPCQSDAVVKYGRASKGTARVRCPQRARCGRTFWQTSASPGRVPYVKQQRGEMTRKGRGIRDLARVLHVGPHTGSKALNKSVRPLVGNHKRGGGVLSRGKQGRSAARGSSGGR